LEERSAIIAAVRITPGTPALDDRGLRAVGEGV
jgi:hypothetical protein